MVDTVLLLTLQTRIINKMPEALLTRLRGAFGRGNAVSFRSCLAQALAMPS